MSEPGEDNPYHISKNRLETMVDAIFAFAMTLLVLGIEVPAIPLNQAASELPGYVARLVPQLIIFVIAFLVLAVFWLEHHRQFHYLRLVDPAVMWLNIAILIFIVLIPFTTDISGDYDGIQIAVILFHVNLLAIGSLFLAHWTYLSKKTNLCDSGVNRVAEKRMQFLTIPPACAIIGIVLSFLSPPSSLYIYLLIPVLIMILKRHS